MKLASVFLFWGLLFFGVCSVGAAEPLHRLTFLRVADGRVVNSAGQQVHLRGFCLDPWRNDPVRNVPKPSSLPGQIADQIATILFDCFASSEDFSQMASLGANVVRKFIQFYPLEAAPYKLRSNWYEVTDDLIAKARANGIYVVLCLTQCAQNVHQEDNKAIYAGRPLLWENPDMQRRVLFVWEQIAARYAEEPAVAAYEILNEPTPSTPQALHAFNVAAIAAIRRHDRRHIIMFERAHRFLSLRGRENRQADHFARPYNDPNIMYSWHYYPDGVAKVPSDQRANPQIAYPSRATMATAIPAYLKETGLPGSLCMITEFSALTTTGDRGLRWTQDFLSVLNDNGLHWTYFPYKNIYPATHRGLFQAKPPGPMAAIRTAARGGDLARIRQAATALLTENFVETPGLREILETSLQDR